MEAWDFCEENASSIEIVYKEEGSKEGILTKIYFNVDLKVPTF